MRRITFDIETSSAVPGNFDPKFMELTVVGVHDSETGTLIAYTVEELPLLWPILERADVLIGYNSDHFDIPILNRYYAGDLTKIKSIDLLAEIKNVLGRRIKLDSVAKGTLGKKKSGSGLDAVRWWAEGKVDKVKKYCLDDVQITKEIFDYALTNNKIRYDDFGTKRDVPLDTARWHIKEESMLTHTLPF